MADYTPFGVVEEDLDHTKLHKKRHWVEGSLRLYHVNHNALPTEQDLEDYEGNTFQEKIADYGLKQMAGFNFNITDQAIDTYTITQKGDQKTKEAFVYMLDQYDEVNSSWHTAKQAGWEMLTDATNWLGIATLGTGAVVSQAAKLTGKKIVKETLKGQVKKSLGKTMMVAGLEGAAHGASYDTMDQAVRVDAGSQAEFNAGQTALSAGVGFVAGAAVGTAIDFTAAKLGSRKARKAVEKKAAEDNFVAEQMAKEAVEEAKVTPKPKAKEQPKTDPDGLPAPKQDEWTGVKMGQLVLRDARDLVNIKVENIIEEVNMNPEFADDVLSRFEGLELHRKEFSQLVVDFNNAERYFGDVALKLDAIVNDTSKSAYERAMAQKAYDENLPKFLQASAGAEHVNSYSGLDLNNAKLRSQLKTDPETGKVTPEALQIAHEKTQLKNLRDVHEKYDPQINKLLSSDDPKEQVKAFEMFRVRDDEAAIIKANLREGQTQTRYDKINRVAERYVEASISGVFSPSTVIINTVFPMLKNYTYPLIDQIISSPLSLTKWRRMVRVYGHMFAAQKAARNSFKAAWEFEQTLLTKDISRFLGEGIKNKGKMAAYMRTFPRLLGSTDAYNQEVAAAGYIAGDAFDRLLTKGMDKKLKGDELKKYIDDNMSFEVNKSYDEKLTVEALAPIYEKGRALKLEGDKLTEYVANNVKKFGSKAFRRLGDDTKIKELRTQADILVKQNKRKDAQPMYAEADELERLAANAKDYVETLLYKKDFETGKTGLAGAMESGAKRLEELHKSHPVAKIFGQLFFRTPAWVFHESARLTPAINLLLPQFRKDLAGLNGVGRQARAQTEATLAFALMMYVTTKWAQGEITGSANRDYTMTGEQETDGLGALSIAIGNDGKTVDYKRFEPLRIPITIMVNALDGVVATREQENFGNRGKGLDDRLLASGGIAMATFISAFQDSALFSGIVDTFTAGSRAVGAFTSDKPDAREDGWSVTKDLALKKALMIVPSIIKKGQVAAGASELTSPVNVKQRVLASFAPNHPAIPRKYDIFGNIREIDNPMTVMNPFWYSTQEQRASGRSTEELEVNEWINELEQSGYGNFTRAKFRTNKLGKIDIREVNIIHDGIEVSLYDAMMAEINKPYIKKRLVKSLHRLSKSTKPLGNPAEPAFHGEPVKDAKKAISDAKEKALERVLMNSKTTLKESGKPLKSMVLERQNKIQNSIRGVFN